MTIDTDLANLISAYRFHDNIASNGPDGAEADAASARCVDLLQQIAEHPADSPDDIMVKLRVGADAYVGQMKIERAFDLPEPLIGYLWPILQQVRGRP